MDIELRERWTENKEDKQLSQMEQWLIMQGECITIANGADKDKQATEESQEIWDMKARRVWENDLDDLTSAFIRAVR